jgi:hypothetical protein
LVSSAPERPEVGDVPEERVHTHVALRSDLYCVQLNEMRCGCVGWDSDDFERKPGRRCGGGGVGEGAHVNHEKSQDSMIETGGLISKIMEFEEPILPLSDIAMVQTTYVYVEKRSVQCKS